MRPVPSAAGLPLQPGALIAASARIPGEGPATFAAVRRFAMTSPEITRCALLSRERPHQKYDIEQHSRGLAEHVSKAFSKFPRESVHFCQTVSRMNSQQRALLDVISNTAKPSSKFFLRVFPQALLFLTQQLTPKANKKAPPDRSEWIEVAKISKRRLSVLAGKHASRASHLTRVKKSYTETADVC